MALGPAAFDLRDETAQNLAEILDFSQTNYFAPQFAVPQGPFGFPCPVTTFIQSTGTNFTVSWLNDSKLQVAPTVTGPWTVLSNSVSPYTFTPTNEMQFFRVVDKWTALVDHAKEFGFPGF